MAAFVLVLFVSGGVTSIPGYPTMDACEAAGLATFERARAKFGFSIPDGFRYICIPGPDVAMKH